VSTILAINMLTKPKSSFCTVADAFHCGQMLLSRLTLAITLFLFPGTSRGS
jgi:hypothetical protein